MFRCMGCMAEIPQNAAQCPHCGYLRGTPPMEAYHLAAETILQGRYIVGRVLGYGGFGVTYIGWDAQLERIVAIKEFLPSTFATRMPGGTSVTVFDGPATEQFGFGLQRFLDEAQRLAQFNGIPGITDIYDTFAQNNTAYIVMQFLNGQDVKAILAAKGPMPYEQAREIILKICDTLAPVHQTGIIHRDLSPDNIYLTRDGEVKLLDFGAARYESGVNSKSLSVILKPGYAPEEQYRSKGEQGSWTDVYALAATFYKMLTGVTPPDSLERAVRDEIKEPSKLGVQMPQSAENALMNALNIRKNDRTQTVRQFKEALVSDGVERVKATPRPGGGSRLPLAGKIAIGIAAVALVAGGIAAATLMGGGEDVVVIGEAAKLADSYGNAVAEGQTLVPNIIGMAEADAAKALEEAGLVLVQGGTLPSSVLAKDVVAAQQPASGAVLDEGAEVTVQVSAGTFWEALDAGLLPQFENVTAPQAVAAFSLLGKTESFRYYDGYDFAYSDTVPAGTVIRYDKPTDGNNERVGVVVSAGQPGSQQVRAPFFYDTFQYMYAAPEVPDGENWPEAWLQVSPNGSDWYDVEQISQGYLGDEDAAAGYAPCNYGSLQDSLLAQYPEFLGQSLQVRISGGGMQSIPFPQTLTLEEVEDTGLQIESMEFVTWEEIEALVEQGVLTQNDQVVQDMQNQLAYVEEDEYAQENLPYSLYSSTPVVARGYFPRGYSVFARQYDYFSSIGNINGNSSTDENGMQTAAFMSYTDVGWRAQNGENYDTEVMLVDWISTYEYDAFAADGTSVTARVTTPLYYTITPSTALAALLGNPPASAGDGTAPGEGAEPEAGYENDMLQKMAEELTIYVSEGTFNDESNFPLIVEFSEMYGVPLEDVLTVLKEAGMPAEQMEKLLAWLAENGYG